MIGASNDFLVLDGFPVLVEFGIDTVFASGGADDYELYGESTFDVFYGIPKDVALVFGHVDSGYLALVLGEDLEVPDIRQSLFLSFLLDDLVGFKAEIIGHPIAIMVADRCDNKQDSECCNDTFYPGRFLFGFSSRHLLSCSD